MEKSVITGLPPRPSDFVRIEADALDSLASRLDGAMRAPFEKAVALLSGTVLAGQRITLTGIGKSGIIARKITAILCSTCSPAHFMHPAEAVHGEAGMLAPSGVVVAFSYSGTTKEIVQLLPLFKRFGMKLITFSGSATSPLSQASDVFLDCSVEKEACMYNLSPTASTSVMLALGDALALAVSLACDRKAEDFENLHRIGSGTDGCS
jgi:arabinose-5-phosphate isomerase